MDTKQTELMLVIFIFSMVIIIGFVVLFLNKCVNCTRIWRLRKMIWKDNNNYRKIFFLLKKIELTDYNKFLSFRVSHLETFENNYRQYNWQNDKPFVSLADIKKCCTIEELKTLIDETKKMVSVKYRIVPLFDFDDNDNLI